MISIKIPPEYHRKLQKIKARFLTERITISYVDIMAKLLERTNWDELEAQLLKEKETDIPRPEPDLEP